MTIPAAPLVDSGQLVDAGNLGTLKQAAAKGNPQALRAAAKQFESLFVSMMLKSMQQANFKDPLFGSDQGDLYQEMYDDQLAAQMTKGKGFGLADMLVQQLRRTGIGSADSPGTFASQAGNGVSAGEPVSSAPVSGATGNRGAYASAAAKASHAGAGPNATTASGSIDSTHAGASPWSTARGAFTSDIDAAPSSSACPTVAQQAEFARSLWPDAQQAARQLGVNPVTLLAQAALETNWGRDVPRDAHGGTSNNLFGIKAATGWNGPAVTNTTTEFSDGVSGAVTAHFRAYASTGHCFQDYVDLLKGNPRYVAALGTGNDVQAFGSALQRGGYATDPAYASKLSAVAGTLTRALTSPSTSLKFAARRPTTDGSGPL